MLHDQKRDIPQLLTAERLAMWLRLQDPKKTYNYFDHCNCLLAQYLNDYGFENVWVTHEAVRAGGDWYEFPDEKFNTIVWPSGTYGEALKRAKALCMVELETV